VNGNTRERTTDNEGLGETMIDPAEADERGATRPGPRGDARVNRQLERIVRTLLEMEYGLRPVGALDTVASPMAARRIRKLVHTARSSRVGTSGPARSRTVTIEMLSSRSTHPSAGVTEGLVIVACENRARPYCVRLEQEGDRWRIVELAPPDAGLRATVTTASRTGAVPVGADGVRRSSGDDGAPFSTNALPGEPVLLVEDGPAAIEDLDDEGPDDGVPSRDRD
jgi:hypothetical protein